MVKMFWLSGTADYFETDYPVVQEGRRNTIFFMYMIETCAFFWKVDKMEEKRQRNSYLSFRVT